MPESSETLPGAMSKVNEELEALNSLVTVLVVVFILLVLLQIIQTILKVMRPKHKLSVRECKPNAVVVQGGGGGGSSSSRRAGGSKKESRSRKGASSSRRAGSLPSKRLCTVLSLSTESECEKLSTSKELCRVEATTPDEHPLAFKRPVPPRSDSSEPLEMSKEMAASLKMLNCADVVSTPLPSIAPLAVPHTPSKSASNSKESSVEDSSGKEKDKKKDSPKTAPTQPPASVQAGAPVVTPLKAPLTSLDPPSQATPSQTTPAAALTTATLASPGVQSTQRASVVESLTPDPKKNSPVKTAVEEVKATPAAPAPATAPPQ